MILDNTKRSLFRSCKAKYNFSCNHGLQSNYGSTAIRFGVCWHAMQEGYHAWVKKNGWPEPGLPSLQALEAALTLGKEKYEKESEGKIFNDDYKNFNTAANLFNEYLEKFKDDRMFLKIIHTEKKFSCDILPETQQEERILKTLPPIQFTGRIDLCVSLSDMNWIFDFKTTGWILDQVISRANRSPQLIGYSYAGARILDFEPSGCLCSFAFVGASKNKSGEYGSIRSDFRRVPQIYTTGDITAWKASFIDTCRDIYRCQEEGEWPQSFDNCYQYGACPYLRLCQQHETKIENLNVEGYRIEFWDVLEED